MMARLDPRPAELAAGERKCGLAAGKIAATGPSIKYVTLFLANFDPTPPVTLCHISGPPKSTSHISDPRFLVGLVQKIRTKAPCRLQILSQLFARVFVRGLLAGVFCPEGFVCSGFCPYPLLSE